MDILNLITSVGGGGVGGIVILWFGKTWINERIKASIQHEYAEKLESHKAALKAEQEIAIERMRADMQIAANEHRIRFTRLHEKVAETVAEIYAHLQKMHTCLAAYVNPFGWANDPPLAERRKEFADALKEFKDYFLPRQIYLPPEITEKLVKFEKCAGKEAMKFMVFVEQKAEPTKVTELWMEASKKMAEEIEPLLQELERDFRKLLGYEQAAQSASVQP